MTEKVLFLNQKFDRPATLEEYRENGGYGALALALEKYAPGQVCDLVAESGLRGRGGAGFPTGRKWLSFAGRKQGPRYVVPNTDEMEPGTFKDRVLVNCDPHLVLEGIILAAYAIQADQGIFFIRPSYEQDAQLIEGELNRAREAGYLGKNILGSDFSFDIEVHRSAGRYICGEASAQVRAIQGYRPNPRKMPGLHLTERGLWDQPTLVNNAETLACIPAIVSRGPQWFKKIARTPSGAGTKLFCVSGRVVRPGCYELPMGTPLREIIEQEAGGMLPGSEFKACLPGGASTRFLPKKQWEVPMDFESLKKIGHQLGTSSIIVFDHNTCLVAATINLLNFFVRESCGWCTPCRDGLPFMRHLLLEIEHGRGKEEYIPMLRSMAGQMRHAYCAFAPGAAEPVLGLLEYFEDEVREHLSRGKCPCRFSDAGGGFRRKQCLT
ncbi:MAG: SLBB domain-containing protein [Desulfobulbaceae bacterium]|nr:SLBB domain-containing protein [Desulfobulbaceae bacterium]